MTLLGRAHPPNGAYPKKSKPVFPLLRSVEAGVSIFLIFSITAGDGSYEIGTAVLATILPKAEADARFVFGTRYLRGKFVVTCD
jgi:hypothetical protein